MGGRHGAGGRRAHPDSHWTSRLALAALSTAAGGRAEVEIRPGWREPCNLYTVVAMPPGSRKSAVFAAMTAPLLEAEAQLVELAPPDRRGRPGPQGRGEGGRAPYHRREQHA
ncbi:DUF3987 domain-containing protein [Pseudonocardia ailaonensis]|uniref:DUF3987 domain-containing protein n=1 Tax=Pseudonocardia ailaonensis TaxID=367279 RepID=UPI003CD088AA